MPFRRLGRNLLSPKEMILNIDIYKAGSRRVVVAKNKGLIRIHIQVKRASEQRHLVERFIVRGQLADVVDDLFFF